MNGIAVIGSFALHRNIAVAGFRDMLETDCGHSKVANRAKMGQAKGRFLRCVNAKRGNPMRTPFVRAVFAAAFAMTTLAFATSAASAAPSVSHSLAKPLTAAQESMKTNDFAGALAHMQEAQAVAERTDFDNYVINQFLGNIYIGLKDYANAAKAFEAMAASPALPPADKSNVSATIVQLAVNTNDWPTAIKYGEQLQAAGPLPAILAEQLAVAYYNSGDHAKANVLAKAQIDADKAAGRQPSQALLQIVVNSQAGSKDMAGAMATLEGLVVDYGDPGDWARLIDPAFGRGMTDLQALNLYRLRIATDAKTSVDDYAIMATVTTKAGYPGETVSMLEHGLAKGEIKPGDQTAGPLAAARQKTVEDRRMLPGFDAQAKARKTGDFDVKVAETYYGYGQYAEAEATARRAISKGGMKDPAEAPMVLGMALARQGKNAEAIEVFSKVGGNANDQKIAHLWTLYCQRKYTTAQTH
jgi:tetratricopeptide (TPR) repeat protein